MHNNRHFWFFWVVILIVISITGCSAGEKEVQPVEEPGPGLANPASVYCQGLGFEEEARENELGQYGVCIFPDGNECDTWDFLAGRCGVENSYCTQQGFTLKGTEEKNIGTCVFGDGSVCDEFAYFQGDCMPGEPYP
jgi:putative hemolysin